MQIKIYIGIFLLVFLCPMFLYATGEDVKVLVIDPGHGGKATGAVGKFSMEKDVALIVSLKFGNLVKKHLPGVKVIYTRTDDRAVDLRERGRIANQNKADLFVSIHCNAVENTTVKGVETFVMGLHKSETNLRVAQLENSDILIEQNHEENYGDFDPSSPDAYIIFSMHQTAFSDKSLAFASQVQGQYINSFKSPNRGVKQAGFLVLWACTMPSVLTEIGFISNVEEEKFLNSEAGQNKIAQSLFEAFKNYKYEIEGFNSQMDNLEQQSDIVKVVDNTEVRIESAPPVIEENINSIVSTDETTNFDNQIVFKVQFASSSVNKEINSIEFKNLKDVSKCYINGIYKYSSGKCNTIENAQSLLKGVKGLGYKDAFIVAFNGETQISTAEAMSILQERNK